MKDSRKLEDLLDWVVGIRPVIMRLPGGSANHSSHLYAGPDFRKGMVPRTLSESYFYFDWNVSSADSASRSLPVEDIVAAVKNNIVGKNEIMVLFHDAATKTTTVEAMPSIIEHPLREGYTFRPVDETAPGFRFRQQ